VSEEARENKEATRHGKDPEPALLKPVRRGGKRGAVVEFFLPETKSILEAMAVLGMTRSGVLTHLHGLNAEHGLGYYLVADQVTLILPDGCGDPFSEAPAAKAAAGRDSAKRSATEAAPDQEKASSGKPMADTVTELKAGSKRAAVALALLGGWKALQAVAEEALCSPASVRSHLHDLHTKHGVGYEYNSDRTKARLLAPEGWRPQ
jgi:predicted ArsR family transcriptional regulator